MIVYIPKSTLTESASFLHTVDLPHNVVSAFEVLQVLHQVDPNWERVKKHPAVRMWRGYEVILCIYAQEMCDRVQNEHENINHFTDYYGEMLSNHLEAATSDNFSMKMPPWMGSDLVHRSHLRTLVFNNPLGYPDEQVPFVQPNLIWGISAAT